MKIGHTIVSRIGVAPLPLATVKKHCRVEIDDDDGLLTLYIEAALSHIEQITRRLLQLANVRWSFQDFPDNAIELIAPPVRELSNISYIDANDVEQTIAIDSLSVNCDHEHAWLYEPTGWPARKAGSFIRISGVSGYGSYDPALDNVGYDYDYDFAYDDEPRESVREIPAELRVAAMLMVGHMYENREATMSGSSRATNAAIAHGVKSLVYPYKNLKV